MKKILSLTLIMILVLASLASCKLFGGKDKNDGNTRTDTETLIWSSDIDTVIVAEDSTTDSVALRFHIFSLTNKTLTVAKPTDGARTHEIIFGDVGRTLSDAAYSKLDRRYDLINLETIGHSAYLIYAESGSLAIAYSDIYARAAATKYIIENITSADFAYEGILAADSQKTVEYVNSFRESELYAEVENLKMYLDGEIVDSLMNFYTLYGSELYIWLANLYDPDIGGFYYSGSARNTEGFLPDLESTGQALELLDNSGLSALYGGNWEKMLPKSITDKLGAFAIGLQHDDGYFYHPQWGTTISSSRRGRDAGWAVDIIKALNLTPKYDTATGSLKGENPVKPSSKVDLTDRLGSSSVVAVSAVVPCAAAELASEEAFRIYLDNANISKNSYSVFNNLNARISEIKNAGLWDFLLHYLTEHQCDNGLWEEEVTYQSVNGLMKISAFFNSTIPFPKPDRAVESVMSILREQKSEEIEAIVYVYNPWVALYNILFYCEDEAEAEYRRQLATPEFVDKTFKRLAAFKRTDGGFSYYPETSSHMSQGEHVAVEGTVESDVNATSIAISTLSYMLRTFKVSPPALYYDYDTIFFIDNLVGLGTLIKDPMVVEDPEVITFDNYNPAEGGESGGVVKYPAETAQNNIGSEDVDENGNYKWFYSSIVENPDPDKYDKVLYVGDRVFDANENGKLEDNMPKREMATTGSNTEFFITNYPINGNCYIFDADVYFAGAGNYSTPVAQIMFVKRGSNDTSMTLNVYAYTRNGGTYLRIAENFEGADGIKDEEAASGIPAFSWVNLRIEVYKEYDVATNALQVKVKFFVNGEYAGSSDSGYYSTTEGIYIDRTISAVKFAYYRWDASSFYLNNVYVAKENKPYVEEGIPGDGDNEISEEKPVYGFENEIPNSNDFFTQLVYKDSVTELATGINGADWTKELDAKYGAGTKSPGIRYYRAYDPTNLLNNVMKVYAWNTDSTSYKGTVYVDDAKMSESASVYEVAFDYYFEEIPWLYATDFFTLGFLSKNGSRLMGITFAAKEIPEGNKEQPEIVLKRDDGSVIKGITLNSDRWYSLKFEYYYDYEEYTKSRLKIYVLDEGGSYVSVYDEITYTKAGVICQLGMEFSPYKIRGNQYFDNLSFALIDKEYTAESVVAFDSVRTSGVVSKVDSGASAEPSPDVNDYRGSGLYTEEAEKYEGETVDSYLPTVGFGNNISLGVTDVDGDRALQFVHAKEAETRFQFKAGAFSGSLVFETDIKFDFLPENSSRGFQIFGAKTVGSNGNVWSGATVNLEYSEAKGGYVLKAAGGEYAVSEGKWLNIRLEVDGLSTGSKVRFYVNGKLYGVSTLTESISGVKAYELLTPNSSSAGTSLICIVSFDNTYLGEKLYDTPSSLPEGSEGNVSGDDLDGGAWD